MTTRLAILVDGGFLRSLAQKIQPQYDARFVEEFSLRCVLKSSAHDEELFRILYYDCPPFKGTVPLPVSGKTRTFNEPDCLLPVLAKKELFAVRRGVLKFRGFELKKQTSVASGQSLRDQDFKPRLVQKGVDLRLGLDVATLTTNRAVERIALVTNDTDMVPAMKQARRGGIQVILIVPQGAPLRTADELLEHADYVRPVPLLPPTP